MPEGPECLLIANNLNELLKSNILQTVIIHSGRYNRHNPPSGYDEFKQDLPVIVERVQCKGKFIWFTTKSTLTGKVYYIFNTLGMSGKWILEKDDSSHIEFIYHSCYNSQDTKSIYFSDVRNFGTFKFTSDISDIRKKLIEIGPCLLTSTDILNQQLFIKRYRKYPKKYICELMMDQHVISGIGNYMRSQILYQSRISPWRTISSLSDEELTEIFQNALKISQDSYNLGGVSVRNYENIYNTKGLYSKYLDVYQQDTDPSGYEVKGELDKQKRCIWWCPTIQH